MVLKRHTELANDFLDQKLGHYDDEVIALATLLADVEARTWERAAKVCDEQAETRVVKALTGDGNERFGVLSARQCAAALRAAAKEE